MYRKLLLCLGVFAIAFSLNAQTRSLFDGKWKVSWQGKRQVFEALLVLEGESGTWKTAASQRLDPCVGREVPVRVDGMKDGLLQITLRFSDTLAGCTDSKVLLKSEPDGSVSGRRGGSELKLVRQ